MSWGKESRVLSDSMTLWWALWMSPTSRKCQMLRPLNRINWSLTTRIKFQSCRESESKRNKSTVKNFLTCKINRQGTRNKLANLKMRFNLLTHTSKPFRHNTPMTRQTGNYRRSCLKNNSQRRTILERPHWTWRRKSLCRNLKSCPEKPRKNWNT